MSTATQVDELATLRQTVVELTAKNATRKARITELEGLLHTAQTATQTAQAELTRIQVTEPMRVLSEAISPVPQLFLAELARIGYTVTNNAGKLTIMDGDKPVEGVDVTLDGLRKHLLSAEAKHSNFPHLITVSKASGGGAIGQAPSSGGSQTAAPSSNAERAKPQFGLR